MFWQHRKCLGKTLLKVFWISKTLLKVFCFGKTLLKFICWACSSESERNYLNATYRKAFSKSAITRKYGIAPKSFFDAPSVLPPLFSPIQCLPGHDFQFTHFSRTAGTCPNHFLILGNLLLPLLSTYKDMGLTGHPTSKAGICHLEKGLELFLGIPQPFNRNTLMVTDM